MSDLISRSEVNNVIDKLEAYTCGRPNTMKVEISVLQLQRFINKLKNIPTAYSVDNTVNELKQAIQNGTIKIESGNSKLFEIVKQGGTGKEI